MKKAFFSLVIILLLVAGVFAADTVYTQISTKTSSANIATGPGVIGGILIATDGTNSVTLNIYDNTDASGTKLIPSTVITTSSANRATALTLDLQFNTGLYISASSSGSYEYTVYYKTR